MSDLVKRLRDIAMFNTPHDPRKGCMEAADLIEQLEAIVASDARWLAAYHQWCAMNGCAPSSSDLIAARKELENMNGNVPQR